MQVNKNIKPIDISTAQTPAYPAGHAFQAYYLAKILSKNTLKGNIFLMILQNSVISLE